MNVDGPERRAQHQPVPGESTHSTPDGIDGVVPAGMQPDADRCLTGPVTDLVGLIDGIRSGTPSNAWAVDRSWMFWTDWDFCATKVNGTHALIAGLEADPDLETITWP